jgi:flagellar biosynthesis chaperone FliJ
MGRQTIVLVSLLVLFGCTQQEAPSTLVPAPAPKPADAASANRYLAYEHTVAIDTKDDSVVSLFDAAQAVCREAVAESCAILEAQVSRGETTYASLRFRAKPEGIRKLLALLSARGEVSSQSTTAEDLAGPIEDTAKKLAMLTDYRAKLEELLARSKNEVDALIKLNRELAETQSQIETLSGTQARLVQRVETEILNVTISSYESQSFWSPIGESTSEFGSDLSHGIATVITALAYLIPWGLVVWLIVWLVRKFWQGRKRNQPAA